MLAVEVFFANGDSLVTSINGTRQSVVEYYLWNVFNIGSVKDNVQRCTGLIFLD